MYVIDRASSMRVRSCYFTHALNSNIASFHDHNGKMYISKFVDTRNVFWCNLIHVYEIIIFFDETIVFREITVKYFRGLRGQDRMVVGLYPLLRKKKKH